MPYAIDSTIECPACGSMERPAPAETWRAVVCRDCAHEGHCAEWQTCEIETIAAARSHDETAN